MVKVSKVDVKYLVGKKILKHVRGKYPELHITSKQKSGKRKTYYVPDYIANQIKK